MNWTRRDSWSVVTIATLMLVCTVYHFTPAFSLMIGIWIGWIDAAIRRDK